VLVGLGDGDSCVLYHIGIALDTSTTPKIIRSPLMALSFHQFFEGIGLGDVLL
ncbi:hypothetical protein ACH5RR_000773, partial [Cinchona calisaya]